MWLLYKENLFNKMPSHHRHYASTLTTPRSWWRVSFFPCWIWRCACISWSWTCFETDFVPRQTKSRILMDWILGVLAPFPAVTLLSRVFWWAFWRVLKGFEWMLKVLGRSGRWSFINMILKRSSSSPSFLNGECFVRPSTWSICFGYDLAYPPSQ